MQSEVVYSLNHHITASLMLECNPFSKKTPPTLKGVSVQRCTLSWANVEQNFFPKIKLRLCLDTSYVTVQLSALVRPLCVIPDYGGDNKMYIVVLPKCNWSRYFGNKIE